MDLQFSLTSFTCFLNVYMYVSKFHFPCVFFSGSPEFVLSSTGLTRAVCGAGEGLGAPGPMALAVGLGF